MDSGRVPSIGTVFEADGERDAGSEFAMELTFGCAGSDGTPGKHCQGKGWVSEEVMDSGRTHDRTGIGAVEQGRLGLGLEGETVRTDVVSRSSWDTGTEREVISTRSCLAMRRPLFILKEPSISGSLMRPFHPTVVRGFSK